MPGPRYTDWTHVHVVGDRAAAAPHVPYGRKLLGYLAEQRARGDQQAVIVRATEDGSVVRAEFIGSIPRITITPATAGGAMEEVLHLYVSASDGLHVYDVGRKKLAQRLTGLEGYTVQEVSTDGGIAWLTGQYALARVDVLQSAAFGFQYAVKIPDTIPSNPPVNGLAATLDVALRADTRMLVHFSQGVTTDGAVREGVGGWVLVDPATLAPVRAPIRMTFEPFPAAWRPDGARFYLGTCRADDVGDLPATSRLADLTTATADYVAAFDADGTLLGTRQLATWDFTPDAGFARLVAGIVASDTRVYVTVDPSPLGGGVPWLFVLDATDDALPVVASLALDAITGAAPRNLCLTRGAETLLLGYDGIVAEVAVADDALAIGTVAAHADFAMWDQSRGPGFPAIQLGPVSRYGGVPDNRRWVYNYGDGHTIVRAYRDVALVEGAPHAVYEFDLAVDGITFQHTYRLASVGTRPRSSA